MYMIYDKFPVVFLSAYLREKEGSTNAVIAKYLLENYRSLSGIGIKRLADECHVGIGSVSRFCKDIGLSDFAELKELIESTSSGPPADLPRDPQERVSLWTDSVVRSLCMVRDSVDMKQVEKLCRDIESYEKISAFGMLKGQAAAADLQVDLMMQGKHIFSAVAYVDQLDHILSAGPDELIIIFSYTGSYFEYRKLRAEEKKLYRPKIWMVCGTEKKMPPYIREKITFASDLSRTSHPFQLEAAASIIAETYACLRMPADSA